MSYKVNYTFYIANTKIKMLLILSPTSPDIEGKCNYHCIQWQPDSQYASSKQWPTPFNPHLLTLTQLRYTEHVPKGERKEGRVGWYRAAVTRAILTQIHVLGPTALWPIMLITRKCSTRGYKLATQGPNPAYRHGFFTPCGVLNVTKN